MEVHIELKTVSKMFCGCKNDPFHAPKPNIYSCPVCLGMPGGLPLLNKRAIEWTIKLGLALGCKINLASHFDRKNYFYPDLAKGYQISQYDQPFCYDGHLNTEQGVVRIHRIHLEEDTGKLLHKTIDGKKVSLIDFNRSGVPLVEVVSEADIHSSAQAKEYAKSLRSILRYLEIADCDMEQGGMRLEANISLSSQIPSEKSFELPSYKVEVKNINSFRFLEHAIEHEVERQAEILSFGQRPAQETRGWSEEASKTVVQRTKEDAADYRYFPDPDIPPLVFSESDIEKIKATLPELPATVLSRWQEKFGVESRFGTILATSVEATKLAEKLISSAAAAKLDSNNLVSMLVNKKLKEVSGNVLDLSFSTEKIIEAFRRANTADEVDESELSEVLKKIIEKNAQAVEQYRAGKTQVLGFFMGQMQREIGKKIDTSILKSFIEKELRDSTTT